MVRSVKCKTKAYQNSHQLTPLSIESTHQTCLFLAQTFNITKSWPQLPSPLGVRIYMYTYMSIYVQIYTYILIYIYICIYIYIYIYIYICMDIRIYIYIYIYTYTHIYKYLCRYRYIPHIHVARVVTEWCADIMDFWLHFYIYVYVYIFIYIYTHIRHCIHMFLI